MKKSGIERHELSALGVEAKRRLKKKYMAMGQKHGLSPIPKSRRMLFKLLTKKLGERDAKHWMRIEHIPIPTCHIVRQDRDRTFTPSASWEKWEENQAECRRAESMAAGDPSLPLSTSPVGSNDEELDFSNEAEAIDVDVLEPPTSDDIGLFQNKEKARDQ